MKRRRVFPRRLRLLLIVELVCDIGVRGWENEGQSVQERG